MGTWKLILISCVLAVYVAQISATKTAYEEANEPLIKDEYLEAKNMSKDVAGFYTALLDKYLPADDNETESSEKIDSNDDGMMGENTDYSSYGNEYTHESYSNNYSYTYTPHYSHFGYGVIVIIPVGGFTYCCRRKRQKKEIKQALVTAEQPPAQQDPESQDPPSYEAAVQLESKLEETDVRLPKSTPARNQPTNPSGLV